jgi:FlaG/FlaF family flagellin (archaellin)/cytoskeletal protein CcmA (bactofilin family)
MSPTQSFEDAVEPQKDRQESPSDEAPERRDSLGFELSSENRAVSPLIGAILLIGGTVMLAAVVGPFIFSTTSGVGDDTPTVDLRFAYSEDVDFESEDSYGTTGNAVGADGLLTITLEDGDRLEANRINVSGGASGGRLTDGSYTDGDTLSVGDSVTVWVNRSNEIEVLWNDEGEDQSTILDRFTVFPLLSGPPGVPDADTDCSYIASQAPGDVTIDGVIVNCDLTAFNIDDLDVINGGGVIGDVAADGEITVNDGVTYQGAVVSGADGSDGDIDLENGTELNSDVTAGGDGDIDMTGGSTIDGDVTAPEEVDLDGGSMITGSIETDLANGNDVTLTGGSTVGGTIDADGDVDVDSSSYVGDDITSAGEVDLDGGTEVRGSIDATGGSGEVELSNSTLDGGITATADVTVDSGSTTGGGISTAGDVSISGSTTIGGAVASTGGAVDVSSSTVDGSVAGSGDVTISSAAVDGDVNGDSDVDLSNSTVGGYTTVGGSFSCSTSTIDGQSCSEYRTPEYVVTIEGTNEPMEEGTELEVTATIENVGIDQGDQTVTLDIDGSQQDSMSLQIDGGDNVTETFRWSTTNGDAGSYVANVSSADDFETAPVTVEDELTAAQRASVTGGQATGATGSTVEFNVENTGSGDITLTHISLDSTTSSTAVGVENKNDPELKIDGTGKLDRGNKNGVEVDGNEHALDSPHTISPTSTATLELKQFVDEISNKADTVDMSGEELTLTLYFADGTEKTVTLSL